MAYKCIECGHIFEEGEQAVWKERRGEHWGTPCTEEMSGCPLCKGDFQKTFKCAICGAEHTEEELHGDVCDDCIDEYRKDFDTCYKISKGETVNVEINALLASIFSVEEIEEIIVDFIRKNECFYCDQFIDEDKFWFGERLVEEVKK